ncbi:MAG: hypothetical protein KBD26_03135 [Candidatus Pacebacteria bacterium]|nr:hypothetical protein [Candidatus Paceibacterota bacterium]MBP9772801.1 hypothetical protein [Candidatus Paceibacterota bacterium]
MNTQEKIAIDIVLLLPENINTICKELNKTSDKKRLYIFRGWIQPAYYLGYG